MRVCRCGPCVGVGVAACGAAGGPAAVASGLLKRLGPCGYSPPGHDALRLLPRAVTRRRCGMGTLCSMWAARVADRLGAVDGKDVAEAATSRAADAVAAREADARLLAGRVKPTRDQALGGNVKVAAILEVLAGAPASRVAAAGPPSALELGVFLAGGRQAIIGVQRQSDERRRSREALAYAIEEVLAGRLSVVAAAEGLELNTNTVTIAKSRYVLGGRLALERDLG